MKKIRFLAAKSIVRLAQKSRQTYEKIVLCYYRGEFKHLGKNAHIEYPSTIMNAQCISIGDNFTARAGVKIRAYTSFAESDHDPVVIIGDNVHLAADCIINCTHRIEIHKNAALGVGSKVMDHMHGEPDFSDLHIPILDRILTSKGPVIIHENAMLGTGVVVLPGVEIGENSVVGSNAVVNPVDSAQQHRSRHSRKDHQNHRDMTFSIVIPAFNGSRFIDQAIGSVLDQQRPADEIVVLDDNSSDDTLDICKKYEGRIRILLNPYGPSGFVKAWDNAIAAANGDFIGILHQDDLLDPEFLLMAEAALTDHREVRHIFSTCHYIDASNKQLSSSYPEGSSIRLYTGSDYFTAYQTLGNPHIHRCPGVLTHKSIFEVCRYDPAAGHIADDDFFYRVGMYTDVIGILKPLASFRIHEGSVTGRNTDASLAKQLVRDYLYQCRQWKNHPFIIRPQYDYFIRNAQKFIRRLFGYGLRQWDPALVTHALRQWVQLKKII